MVCPTVGQPVETTFRKIQPSKWEAAKNYLVKVYVPALNAIVGTQRGILCYEDKKQYAITCILMYKVR